METREVFSWNNAGDFLTLGLSVAGMGAAGASVAKSGATLKSVWKDEITAVSAAVSNATKKVVSSCKNTFQERILHDNRGMVDLDAFIKSGSDTTKLYRAMSEAEYDSVMSNGKFVPYDRAMEEKWFATTQEEATSWGKLFYPDGNHRMVEIEVDTSSLSKMYYNQKLDNIGPAYCTSLETLENAIKKIKGVK